ncbi:MAG: FAD-binding protein [Lachnospiraceae bacterium]|nr:FAD-binding protein [Lachnospiraceae bacterium]
MSQFSENTIENEVNESRMLTNKVAGFSAHCRNGQAAPCMGECPYHLDVRGLMQKVSRGSFRGAYNILSDALVFPETLCSMCAHACKEACGAELGGVSIDLSLIERTVIANAPRRGVQKFRVPPKEEKIAVIGAGLSGMTAAYTLGALGYQVTVFEKTGAPGGALKGKIPAEVYEDELNSVFSAGNIKFEAGREITDLSEMSDYDGIIAATGKEGTVQVGQELSGFCREGNVFFIGELTGAPITASVEYGRKAGTAMDRYLKAGEEPDPDKFPAPGTFELRYYPDPHDADRESAAQEAQRCRMCDCTKCVDVCEFMKYYKKVPPRFEIDIPGTLNPIELVRKRSSTRLLMSCDDCRLCEQACPEKIKTGDVLMQVRTAMAHDKVLPAAFHDFWIRDMEFSCSDEAAYFKKPENGYLYFPGCLLGGSDPENVTGSYELINKIYPGCGIYVGCCGIPAKWAGETALLEENCDKIRGIWKQSGRPVFITACPSCRRNLNEFLPEIKAESIYNILAEHTELFGKEILGGEELTVFHPCSSHFDPREQESVVALIRAGGGNVRELEDPSDRNGCCGYGGHIYYTNPGLYDRISEKRANADERPYITYCANCRDVLTEKGKDTSHILKVLSDGKRISVPAPSLTGRRENRKRLKAMLEGKPVQEDNMKLDIPQELVHSMDRALILNSDVEAVIRHCEETGRFLINGDGDHIGHLKIGMVTYWVTWKKEGDTYRILNAYDHRMSIVGE